MPLWIFPPKRLQYGQCLSSFKVFATEGIIYLINFCLLVVFLVNIGKEALFFTPRLRRVNLNHTFWDSYLSNPKKVLSENQNFAKIFTFLVFFAVLKITSLPCYRPTDYMAYRTYSDQRSGKSRCGSRRKRFPVYFSRMIWYNYVSI